MSDIHKTSERPAQWRVPCAECGNHEIERLRMHSQLRPKHLRQLEIEPDTDTTYVQCNNCGSVREV